MLKKWFKKGIGIFTAILIVGVSSQIVTAESFAYSFDVTVTKLQDGESSAKTKLAGYSRGAFSVDTMSVTGHNYQAWIERSSTGTNVSKVITFSSPTSSYSVYIRAKDEIESYDAKLNISTSLETFKTCDMTGTWTPNAYHP